MVQVDFAKYALSTNKNSLFGITKGNQSTRNLKRWRTFVRQHKFFAGQNEICRTEKNTQVSVGLSTDFNHQFAKTLVLMNSESKRK